MLESEFFKSLCKLLESHNQDQYPLIHTFLSFKLISLKDKYDNWPLMCAALKMSHDNPANCTPVVQSLLSHGCDANAREDVSGETVLMLACQKGCAQCARALIKAGAKLETKDDAGKTAVIHATIQDNVDAFRALVEHNANTEVSYNNQTLFDYAKQQRRQKVLRVMRIKQSEKE